MKSILVLVFMVSIFGLNTETRVQKNGFDLSNASIPYAKVLSAAPV